MGLVSGEAPAPAAEEEAPAEEAPAEEAEAPAPVRARELQLASPQFGEEFGRRHDQPHVADDRFEHAELPDAHVLLDGPLEPLSKSGLFVAENLTRATAPARRARAARPA